MPDVADKTTREILGRSLIVGATILGDARRGLMRIWAGPDPLAAPWRERAGQILTRYTKALAVSVAYSKIISATAGIDWAFGKAPRSAQEAIESAGASFITPERPRPPGRPPGLFSGLFDDPLPSGVRFPKLERAAESLIERSAMTRPQFDQLTDAAKAEAFTVAGDITDDTIVTIQETLQQNTIKGTSLEGFRQDMGDRLESSFLGDHHAETVYRTNVQAAFRDGRETMMQNPVMAAMFPYQEYVNISDDRTREEHQMLGALGLDGTGVYRRDDPFWDYFTPPWDYNCRCGVNLLTKEAAARKGVKEAQRWVETGQRPSPPEWRWAAIPFPHNPGFGSRGVT